MSFLIKYFKLQCKRTAKAYVTVLALTMALLLIMAAIGFAVLENKKNDQSFRKVVVGLVGDKEDKLFNMGLTLLKKVDNSQFTVDFLDFTSEEKAIDALKNEKIDAYLFVPKNFAKSVWNGENMKATYVFTEKSASMGSLITSEVIDVVSNYVIETQAGVTAMCDYAEDLQYSSDKIHTLDVDMSIEYVRHVLKRESLSQITEIGMDGSLSMVGYYMCGFTVFFLLCFGVACCTVRVKQNSSFDKLLYSKGYGTVTQILGEFLPYLLVIFLTTLIPLSVVGIISTNMDFAVTELKYWIFGDYFFLAFKILPVILVVTTFQFFLYETVFGIINSVLLQFTVSVVLSYICGCFYPIYFFPEIVQKISSVLPVGMALNYFKEILVGKFDPSLLAGCLCYGLFFLLASGAIRKAKIRYLEGQ